MSAATGKEGDEVYTLFKYIVRQEIIVITKMKKKMKKLIYFVAAFAAVATFYSCSSDDVLDDIQQPTPEVEEVAQGKPFSLTVTTDGDKTTRFATVTDATLSSVNLFAKTSSQTWINNLTFTKDGDVFKAPTDATITWGEGASTIYAYSENGAASPSNVDASDIANGKIEYALPTTTAEVYGWRDMPTEGEIYLNNLMETNVVDLSKCTDLLVGKATVSEVPDDGKLTMTLDHAIAKLELGAQFTSSYYDTEEEVWKVVGTIGTSLLEIDYVFIYGLKTKGTYDLTTGQWTVSDFNNENVANETRYYQFVPETVEIPAQDLEHTTNHVVKVWPLATGDNAIPVIPQTFTPWDYNSGTDDEANVMDGYAYEKGLVYIGIKGKIYNNFGKTGTPSPYNADNDYGQAGNGLYIMLKVSGNEFKAGKRYRLSININKVTDGAAGGTYVYDGAGVN